MKRLMLWLEIVAAGALLAYGLSAGWPGFIMALLSILALIYLTQTYRIL